jgi:hypothetical protein
LYRRAWCASWPAWSSSFEDTTHDVTTARDGRVVKLIGDEVMFVARGPSVTTACLR